MIFFDCIGRLWVILRFYFNQSVICRICQNRIVKGDRLFEFSLTKLRWSLNASLINRQWRKPSSALASLQLKTQQRSNKSIHQNPLSKRSQNQSNPISDNDRANRSPSGESTVLYNPIAVLNESKLSGTRPNFINTTPKF